MFVIVDLKISNLDNIFQEVKDFYYSGETKTEEGSYWIDEDEPSPF